VHLPKMGRVDDATDNEGLETEEGIYIYLRQREPAAVVRATPEDQRGERRGRPWFTRRCCAGWTRASCCRGMTMWVSADGAARPTVRVPRRGPRHHGALCLRRSLARGGRDNVEPLAASVHRPSSLAVVSRITINIYVSHAFIELEVLVVLV
jgi:hypothetical protein